MSDPYGVYAHEHATVAYKISDEWGDSGCVIVWARNPMEAKRVGSSHFDKEYDEVECEREPRLDGFQGDLLGWLIDDGWYFPCQKCEARDPKDGGAYVRSESDAIYCSVECRDSFEAYWAKKKALEKEFQRFAEVKYFGLDVRVSYVNVAGDAHVQARVRGTSRYEYGGFILRSELDRSAAPCPE